MAVNGVRLIRKSEPMQRPVKPLAASVSGKYPALFEFHRVQQALVPRPATSRRPFQGLEPAFPNSRTSLNRATLVRVTSCVQATRRGQRLHSQIDWCSASIVGGSSGGRFTDSKRNSSQKESPETERLQG